MTELRTLLEIEEGQPICTAQPAIKLVASETARGSRRWRSTCSASPDLAARPAPVPCGLCRWSAPPEAGWLPPAIPTPVLSIFGMERARSSSTWIARAARPRLLTSRKDRSADAYIASARSTAGGRRNGQRSPIFTRRPGARVLDAIVAETGSIRAAIDDVTIVERV